MHACAAATASVSHARAAAARVRGVLTGLSVQQGAGGRHSAVPAVEHIDSGPHQLRDPRPVPHTQRALQIQGGSGRQLSVIAGGQHAHYSSDRAGGAPGVGSVHCTGQRVVAALQAYRWVIRELDLNCTLYIKI